MRGLYLEISAAPWSRICDDTPVLMETCQPNKDALEHGLRTGHGTKRGPLKLWCLDNSKIEAFNGVFRQEGRNMVV